MLIYPDIIIARVGNISNSPPIQANIAFSNNSIPHSKPYIAKSDIETYLLVLMMKNGISSRSHIIL